MMFSIYGKDPVAVWIIVVFLGGFVRPEFQEWIWNDDVGLLNHSISSLTMSTTASSTVSCMVICSEWFTMIASTLTSGKRVCECNTGSNGLTSYSGSRLWNNIPAEYEGSESLGFFVKLYENYWYTFDEASARCALDGARLVVIDTMEKFSLIPSLPGYKSNLYYLVGANDNEQEDTFVWSTGSLVSRDTQLWHIYQPNNAAGNQNCLTLFRSQYDDVTCTNDFKFICELV